jgi:hypothetical protein
LMSLVFLVGCGDPMLGSTEKRPGQAEVEDLVWNQIYRETHKVPTVYWVEGEDLTCINPVSGRPGFIISSGQCRDGNTVVPNFVQVGWRTDDRYSTTTLSHEFRHAALLYRGIFKGDPFHSGEGWRPWRLCLPGEDPEKARCCTSESIAPTGECGIVDYAETTLDQRGQ